jgi:hypothetical protein
MPVSMRSPVRRARLPMKYRICDSVLESDIPLPELEAATTGEPDWRFRLLPQGETAPAISEWFHHWELPDGQRWLSLAKLEAGYLLRFPSLADFVVSDGSNVSCYPQPGVPLDTLRHLFLDQVTPVLLSARGEIVLHASAVAGPGGVIAFFGKAGQGKSTLAASFVRHGFSLLTDDCLLLRERPGGLVGVSSYPGLRLWPDSAGALFDVGRALPRVSHYSSKKRLTLGNRSLRNGAAPLARAYLLAAPDSASKKNGITITSLSPRDALMQLIQHAYRLDITDRDRLAEEFEQLSRIASLPLFYELSFPRDFGQLAAVREAVLAHSCI